MAKTGTAEADTSQKDEARRQRKRQARREAKIMLKIEQAKKAIQKAQKKLTRAQSSLDEDQTHLHDLEAKLQQIRSTQEPQAQETPGSQTPQDTQAEEQFQAPTSQMLSEELPELKPEDFQIQEAIDEAYQEPLLMPASTPPQADTDAIEAFHIASITPVEGRDDVASEEETDQTQQAEEPAEQVIYAQVNSTFEPVEGRSDLSTDQTTDTTSPDEQPLKQPDTEASSAAPNEQNPSSEAIVETNTTTPEDTTTEDNTPASWQDEDQSLVEHGNEEPELSNNPLASKPEKNETPSEATVEASEENKEENLQA